MQCSSFLVQYGLLLQAVLDAGVVTMIVDLLQWPRQCRELYVLLGCLHLIPSWVVPAQMQLTPLQNVKPTKKQATGLLSNEQANAHLYSIAGFTVIAPVQVSKGLVMCVT
jgi:hypothetical protein